VLPAVIFALSTKGKESENHIADSDADPDQQEHFITSKLGQIYPSLKNLAKFACNVSCNAADEPTERQINVGYHTDSLSEILMQ